MTQPSTNRIDKLFESCQQEKRAALILYLTSGFPNKDVTKRLLPVLASAGCDLLELGIPFSDPIADGPTIQKASSVALDAGITFQDSLNFLTDFRKSSQMPVILFGALNPFLIRGLAETVTRLKNAGADGVLAADLPLDESDEFRDLLEKQDMHLVTLIAPTTPDERLAEFGGKCTGFLYCISYKGTTGTKSITASSVSEYLTRLRKHISIPLALGFGIKTPEDVRTAVAAGADAVVVGTALIELIEKTGSAPGVLEKVLHEYIASLSAALTRKG